MTAIINTVEVTTTQRRAIAAVHKTGFGLRKFEVVDALNDLVTMVGKSQGDLIDIEMAVCDALDKAGLVGWAARADRSVDEDDQPVVVLTITGVN
jgi:hypothetical protein